MLNLEVLERRELPAGGIVPGIFFDQPSGTLTLVGTNGNDVIDARTLALNTGGSVVQATVNNQLQSFNAALVTKIVALGLNGDDDISTFNTPVVAVVDAGAGDDMVQTGPASGDVVFTGKGKDRVYAILGADTIVSVDDNKQDLLFGSAAGSIVSDDGDQQVVFFGAGRTPGAGGVQLLNGVLYLTPPDGGSSTQLFQVGNQILLVTDWAGVQQFRAKDIDFVGYFGGNGNDLYSNQTKISEVGYGGLGGNDTLTGGTGKFTLLKGGNGNDVVSGRSGENDLAGQGGTDVINSIRGKSRLRVDALDTFFSRPADLFFLP